MPTTAVWQLRSEARFWALVSLALLIAVGTVVLATAAFLIAFVSLTASLAAPLTRVSGGNLQDLTSESPVYFLQGDFWLVRTANGRVLALHARDTRSIYRDGALVYCPVRWLPEFWYFDFRDRSERMGWFRADCSGSTFALDGARVFGPSPFDLSQYPVTVSTTGAISVIVDKHRLIKGGPGPGVRVY